MKAKWWSLYCSFLEKGELCGGGHGVSIYLEKWKPFVAKSCISTLKLIFYSHYCFIHVLLHHIYQQSASMPPLLSQAVSPHPTHTHIYTIDILTSQLCWQYLSVVSSGENWILCFVYLLHLSEMIWYLLHPGQLKMRCDSFDTFSIIWVAATLLFSELSCSLFYWGYMPQFSLPLLDTWALPGFGPCK